MKEEILEKIPGDKSELRAAIQNSNTTEELLGVLIKDFGIDRTRWEDWQIEVEKVYLDFESK